MLNILAVSDEKCNPLIAALQSDVEYYREKIDLVVSCGDLPHDYVELIASILNKMVYYVEGNHYSEPVRKVMRDPFNPEFKYNREPANIPGGINLHQEYLLRKRFRIIGFGGSLWYNGEGMQFREGEMRGIVRGVRNKITFNGIKQAFFKKNTSPLIVVSHSPIAGVGDGNDKVHKGFKSFRVFAQRYSPVLWLYGHIHLNHYSKVEVHNFSDTVAVNCFGYKFISLTDDDEIRVSFNARDLWE